MILTRNLKIQRILLRICPGLIDIYTTKQEDNFHGVKEDIDIVRIVHIPVQ